MVLADVPMSSPWCGEWDCSIVGKGDHQSVMKYCCWRREAVPLCGRLPQVELVADGGGGVSSASRDGGDVRVMVVATSGGRYPNAVVFGIGDWVLLLQVVRVAWKW